MTEAEPTTAGAISVRGVRGTQQGYQHDRVLTHVSAQGSVHAVFDGHGATKHGHEVAEMCKQRFLPFLQASAAWNAAPVTREERDEDLVETLSRIVGQLERDADPGSPDADSYPGTTLCAVLIKDGWLYTVNVGDSRAVLAEAAPQNGRKYTLLTWAVQLTRDHVCSDLREQERVEDADGVVENGRLNGDLEMSRTIGDHDFKTYRNHPRFNKRGVTYKDTLLVSTPEINARRITEKDIFVVLATDGLWSERVRNDMVILHAEGGMILNKKSREIAQSLVSLAIEYGSKDNISIVFIPLNKLPEREKRSSWRMRRKTALIEDEAGTESERLRNGFSTGSARRPRFGFSRGEDLRGERTQKERPTQNSRLVADMPKQTPRRVLIRQAPKRLFRRRNGEDPRQAL